MRRLDVPRSGNLDIYLLRNMWRTYWEDEIVPEIVWKPTPIEFANIEWETDPAEMAGEQLFG
jgi:hypothetical protein